MFFPACRLYARTLNLPLGLQLYSVRQQLPGDFAGTLKQLGALGYKEVEASGYYDHSVADVRQAMQDAGLRCVSAHYPYTQLNEKFDEVLAFNRELGVGTIICASPGFKDPSRVKDMSPRDRMNAFTLDDWRWNADQFNMFGAKLHAAGMKFGYHNHIVEFHEMDGSAPYAELMRLTDPSKVTFELDCGWAVVGGASPVDLLKQYPNRISMLHVKDFKQVGTPAAPVHRPESTELGRGVIDYRPIFKAAAKTGNVKHCFVEQEGFDIPPMDSLKVDADYIRKLRA